MFNHYYNVFVNLVTLSISVKFRPVWSCHLSTDRHGETNKFFSFILSLITRHKENWCFSNAVLKTCRIKLSDNREERKHKTQHNLIWLRRKVEKNNTQVYAKIGRTEICRTHLNSWISDRITFNLPLFPSYKKRSRLSDVCLVVSRFVYVRFSLPVCYVLRTIKCLIITK
jgi:hypothetical protein